MSLSGKNTHAPGNTILLAAAITGMLALNGCSVQKSLGAKTYHENMIAIQCSADARKFCNVIAGNRFTGYKQYSHCKCISS